MEPPRAIDFDQFADLINDDILFEHAYLEFKKALGRDGRGELPTAFFETYSAMANTDGGVVILGVEERPKGHFTILGIPDINHVISQLWDELHNRNKVNINILREEMVAIRKIEEKNIIIITIPRAERHSRPIFVGENPFTGTYRRSFEGDYLVDEATVRRMIAEQVAESRDNGILDGFDIVDLDQNTLAAYRNLFRTVNIGHLWNDLNEIEFLKKLGGYTTERIGDKKSGLTLAGILMFGTWTSITEAVPHYFVDYREFTDDSNSSRWSDRLIPDGTWSGNLYDFFLRAQRKLYRDLKVPFQLQKGQRIEDSPVHEAVREALINAVIHADYSGTTPVLIERYPHMITFRNPGSMRIPIYDAIKGGNSDCRNRTLQKMFRMIGYGEQAGSGIPSIYENWQSQTYRSPEIIESFQPEMTTLVLRMVSLLPEEVIVALTELYGAVIASLSSEQKLALATAYIEGVVTHGRIMGISSVHPTDLTKELKELVDLDLLIPDGEGRGRSYHLYRRDEASFPGPQTSFGSAISAPERIASAISVGGVNANVQSATEHLGESSVQLPKSSVQMANTSEHSVLQIEVEKRLLGRKKVPSSLMEDTILSVCTNPLTLEQLADLLHRSPDTIRTHYLNSMVKRGVLELIYPEKRTHPSQAYRTTRNQERPTLK